MATRVEEIFTAVAEVAALPPGVLHWGKREAEARTAAPTIDWHELDDGESVDDPSQHESEWSQSCGVRIVPVQITCTGRDPAESEDLFHVVLAAVHNTVSRNGYAWGPVKKLGERPNSDTHVRAIVILFKVAVLSEEYVRFRAATATTTVAALDPTGQNPEQGVP